MIATENRIAAVLAKATPPRRTVAQILAGAKVTMMPDKVPDIAELTGRINALAIKAKHKTKTETKTLATRIAALTVRATQSKATESQQNIPVSVKAIIRDQEGRVLVLKDANSDWDDLPGGHLHAGENFKTGLEREVKEETGLDATVGEHIATIQAALGPKEGPWVITTVKFYDVEATGQVKLSHEHTEAVWLTHDQLHEANLGKFKNTVLGWTAPKPVTASSPIHATMAGLDEWQARQDAKHPTAAHDAARDAAEAIYLKAIEDEAVRLKEKADKKKREEAILIALLLASEHAYLTTYAALNKVAISASRTAGQPLPPAPSAAALNDEAVSFATQRTPLLTSYAARLEEDLTAARQLAEEDGQDEEQVAKTLRQTAREESATMAATEAQATYGASQMAILKRSGFTSKAWISMGDDRVRPTHVDCDAQGAIPIDAKFSNGLLYPGDPNGPASETMNCRCNLVGVSR